MLIRSPTTIRVITANAHSTTTLVLVSPYASIYIPILNALDATSTNVQAHTVVRIPFNIYNTVYLLTYLIFSEIFRYIILTKCTKKTKIKVKCNSKIHVYTRDKLI